MAREIEVKSYCDAHLARDERVAEAQQFQVTIDGREYVIDLCEPCEKELIAPLRDLLVSEGHRPSQPVRATAMGCPSCGKPYKNRESLRKHMLNTHGLVLSEVEQQANDSSTAKTKSAKSKSEPALFDAEEEHACPDCEKTFARAQGLGAHRARVHGYRAAAAS